MHDAVKAFLLGAASIGIALFGSTLHAMQSTGGESSAATAKSAQAESPSTQIGTPNALFNAMSSQYGLRCDLTQYVKGSISAGSAVLKGSGFTKELVGRKAIIWGAGKNNGTGNNPNYGPLVTTVLSYQDPTQVTLSAPAETAVPNPVNNSEGLFEIGTDDTAAIQAAYNAAAAHSSASPLQIPAHEGKSCLTGAIDLSAGGTTNVIVPIDGQGSTVSSLTGLPGQDVLQWPDGRKVAAAYSHIKGVQINVDGSIDVSCAAQANCPGTGNSQTSYGRVAGLNGARTLNNRPPAISDYSLADGVLTVTLSNAVQGPFQPGMPVYFSHFTGGLSPLNNKTLMVLSSPAPTASSFAVRTSLVTGSGKDTSGTISAMVSITPPISPGPVPFANAQITQSSDGTYDELYIPSAAPNAGAFLNAPPPWVLYGQPLSIPSIGLNSTMTTDIDQNHAKFTPAHSGAASGLTGTWGKGLAPPWFIGNCGLSIAASDGNNVGGVQMIFEDVTFRPTPGTRHFSNHTCAMFFQQAPYRSRFTRITTQFLYYGYIEAIPLINNQQTWTPDTSTYHDVDFNTVIPLVQIAGGHRLIDGMNIYDGSGPFALGPFFLNGPEGLAGNSTITHLYQECWVNSGENARWQGVHWTITGSSLSQCGGSHIVWQADQSFLANAAIGGVQSPTPATAGLQLLGNGNLFEQTDIYDGGTNSSAQVNDLGLDNTVISDYRAGSGRRYAVNGVVQPPAGQLDGMFLATNLHTPFTSMSDLFTRCADWRPFLYGVTGNCAQDPDALADGNIAGNYYTTSSTKGSAVFHFNGTPLMVGRRLPQTRVNVIVFARAQTAGSQKFILLDETDRRKPLQTCTYSMTTSFAQHGGPGSSDACVFDLSSVPVGHVIAVQWMPIPASSSEQIAWIAFPPVPESPAASLAGTTDVITGSALHGSCQSKTVSVAGATVGSPVAVSATNGADLGANFNLRASVTAPNTVTVYICGTGVPPSYAYNVKVY
jgi:hypothetical protein